MLRTRWARALVRVLITLQYLATTPTLAMAQSPGGMPTAPREQPSPAAKPAPASAGPATTVKVNRTRPAVTAPALTVRFDEKPTTESLRRARVLPEALRPVGRMPSDEENRVLARALEAFATEATGSPVSHLERFLLAHPQSPWRAAVLVNVAAMKRHEGYFSRAGSYWTDAWTLAKNGTDPDARAIADVALAEWATQALNFGQIAALTARLDEAKTRIVGGTAGVKLDAAREGLRLLTDHHELAIFSGPEAIKTLAQATGALDAKARDTIAAYRAPHTGTSLVALRDLSRRAGVPLEMRYLSDVADVPVPSIVHLKSEHYSAIVERRGDQYLVRDPALGGELAMSAAALRDEASGYLLVPAQQPAVGRVVGGSEGETIVGHCAPGMPWNDDECGCGGGPPGSGRGPGMPSYTLHPMTAAVVVTDTPLVYAPPVGPSISFTLRYNHRSQRLGQTLDFGGVGRRWSTDWLSWVRENDVPGQAVGPYSWTQVVLRGEGEETYHPLSGYTHWKSRASLVRVSLDPARYERRLPDGTVEVFEFADRAASLPGRKIYLTQVIDPQGHTLTFTYDANIRLVAVTDAVGQVTTFEYLDPADPLRITTVTDPFGRTALLTYDQLGRLASVTDAVGMSSSFAYDDTDFLVAMTTPYGTTTFRRGESLGLTYRRVEATDPEGGTERVEYRQANTASLPETAPPSDVPSGFSSWNQGLHLYNSLYWNKRAMSEAPGDVSRATITHWLLASEMAYSTHQYTRNIPHSVKRPLERRIWYRYPDQAPSNYGASGTGTSPVTIARVLEGGATQLTQMTYNAEGMITSKTDPVGRQTTYTYAANGIDLLQVHQGADLVATYGGYNSQHFPATMTDAAGQTTTTTYNAAGQPLTVTNGKKETTTYTYDTGPTGYLLSVTGPVTGATTTFTYDALGRTRIVTDPDGYAVTTDYDGLNRVTKRTYPDGTFEQFTYQRLDVIEERDRKGRVTRHYYDGVGRRTATRDPLGRVIRQEWCACGSLEALIDAKGQRTSWERDAQGRVTREVRADGATDTLYTYDATGRLKTITDPKDQVTTHTYLADDSLSSTTFTNAVIATPGVSYTYDPVYPRVATMVDGIGTTTYGYKAAGQLGAGQVATVDGPLTDDVIAYSYDELGRVTSRSINGAANPVTWTFDALGRVTTEVNVLGTFTYTYDGVTSRLATVTYPNGQTSAYSYLPTSQDHRLQTIHHRYPGGATLSKFDYTYDVVGNILTWQQQADSDPAVLWTYGYDNADQLTSALQQSTGGTPTVLKRYGYGYDPAGNRTFEQIDDQVTAATHDNLNRLLTQAAGGALQFRGTVNEPASVTIQGKPAVVDSMNTFRGAPTLSGGTSTVSIVATDPSGNQTTKQYEVNLNGGAKAFTYDASGNLTSDGARAFEWDARNQLVAVTDGTHRSEFTYDGHQRRIREIEKENSAVQSDSRVLWCEMVICEERGADGTTVNRLAFRHGERVAWTARFIVTDHLNSVTDVANSSGSLLGRYAYDSWGRRTVTAGSDVTSEAFTGHRWQSNDSLLLAFYRGYDPDLGIWISEDPMGLSEGPNFYRYVAGNPVRYQDPLGLAIHCTVSSIREQLVGGKCPTGAGACTDAAMRRSATPCTQSSCGPWSFTGTVDIRYTITYIQPKRSRGADGNPYETHEWLHIGDLQGWCSSLSSKYPSEGFGSAGECNVARVRFLSETPKSFQDARNQSTKNRD